MLSKSLIKNNIYYLSKENLQFSELYLAIRAKEKRVLSDAQVKSLPIVTKANANYKEWALRVKSTNRFVDYLKLKENNLKILDIGCGNGWFTNAIAKTNRTFEVIGLDINVEELRQAARVFNKKNLSFAYGNIYEIEKNFDRQFDIITLNACIQYFPDLQVMIKQLKNFLNTGGEIHIIDSPFYKRDEIVSAKQRSVDYYSKLGYPEMAKNYFHHSLMDIRDAEILYQPNNNIVRKLLRIRENPFKWIRIKNIM